MEGNYCRKLIANARDVMDAIKAQLLQVPKSQRAVGCDDNEIIEYCDAIQRLFQYMNVISHYAYQPTYSVTTEEMILICDCVSKMDCLWRRLSRNVPPKVHGWQHLVYQMEILRGMLHHQESKIEVAHQVGRQMDLQFRTMASQIDKKIRGMMQFLANQEDPMIAAEHAFIIEETSRNFSEETKAKRAEKEAETKRLKSSDIKDILDAPEITTTFKTMLELTVDDRMAAAMEVVDPAELEDTQEED